MGVYYDNTRRRWAGSFFIRKDGRRVRRILYKLTREEAEDALAAARVALKAGTFQSPGDAARFEDLCATFLAAKRADVRAGTLEGYEGLIVMYLLPFFSGCRVRDLTRADVEAFKAAMLAPPSAAVAEARLARYVKGYGADEARWRERAARPVGRRTVAKALTLLSSLFATALDHRWATYNPAANVRKGAASGARKIDAAHVLTVAETRRLLEATPARWRPLVRCAVETGLRQAELFGLQWGDVDLAAGLVRVRRQWQRGALTDLKTRHSQRTVPLTPGLALELKKWSLAAPKSELDLVFPNDEGRAPSASNFLSRVFYPAFRRCGFERAELAARRFTFHQLRHTFASTALQAGIAVAEVSRYLGHSSIVVTLSVYAHVIPGGHDAARAKLAGLYDDVRPRAEGESGVNHLRLVTGQGAA